MIRALGVANDFDTDDGSEDEEAKKKYDVKQAKTKSQLIMAKAALKTKLTRDAIKGFKKSMRRTLRNKAYDPF